MNESYHTGQINQLSLFSDIPQISNIKKCSACTKDKYLDEYSRRKDGRYEARCKECIREADRLRCNTDEHNTKRREKNAKRLALSDKRLLNSPALPPPPILSKVCPQCDPPVEKPISEFGLGKDRKDEHNTYCKECTRRIANSEKSKARRKKYEESLGEEFIKKKYAGGKRWREENIETLRVQWREKYANDLVYATRMRVANRKWAKAHPLEMQERQLRRIARIKESEVEPVDLQEILDQYGRWCYICSQEILPSQDLVFDHVIPLIPRPGDPKGTHTADNLRPAHRECNGRKSNRRLDQLTDFDRRGPDK